jgi:hypothetical protein
VEGRLRRDDGLDEELLSHNVIVYSGVVWEKEAHGGGPWLVLD